MAEEEYYYEEEYQYEGGDDGGDAGGDDAEETWETAIENTYADAKAQIDAKPEAAEAGFKQVIATDQDKGKWTFKALKMLCRTYQRARNWDAMVATFERMIHFHWADRGRNDTEKAINKFLDRCAQVPPETMLRVYDVALVLLEREKRTLERLWFSVRLRRLQLMFDGKQFDAVLAGLEDLKTWCYDGDAALHRKGTQLLSVLAVEIQIYSERNEQAKLRNIYTQSQQITTAIAPPRVVGIIKECGGKLFMRSAMWAEAHEAFLHAFRSFDEAGDPRRLACLKYLVLASMLSGSAINPFDTNEARSYQNDPEIKAMTELISACEKNDIKAFERVLKDKKNSKAILEDPFLFGYLEPLIRRVRGQVLLAYVRPYRVCFIRRIAAELNIGEEEAESLCVSLILDGLLKAQLDQQKGTLVLTPGANTAVASTAAAAAPGGPTPAGVAPPAAALATAAAATGGVNARFEAIDKWCDAFEASHKQVMNRIQLTL